MIHPPPAQSSNYYHTAFAIAAPPSCAGLSGASRSSCGAAKGAAAPAPAAGASGPGPYATGWGATRTRRTVWLSLLRRASRPLAGCTAAARTGRRGPSSEASAPRARAAAGSEAGCVATCATGPARAAAVAGVAGTGGTWGRKHLIRVIQF